MRSLTVVKDIEGNVKIAQFGNVWEEDEPNIYTNWCNYFKEYVQNKSKMDLLLKQLPKIKFFSPEEYIEFQKKIQKESKIAYKYDNEFLVVEIGVHILDRAPEFNKNTRLESYYKYVGDTMFASVIFEIDFNKGLATIKNLSNIVFSYRFSEAHEPPKIKTSQRGRPKK